MSNRERLLHKFLTLEIILRTSKQSQQRVSSSIYFSLSDINQILCLIDAEKLLKIKGVIDFGATKSFDIKKDQTEFELSVGSSYLHN